MKYKWSFLLVVFTLCLATLTHAKKIMPAKARQWRPVVAVGGGVATTTNLGKAHTFSIQDPATDEYYIYSPTHRTQTQAMGEIFLGAEYPLFSHWLLQGGLAYDQTGSYQAKGNFIQGTDFNSQYQYTYQYNLWVREVMVQAKLMRSYDNKFYPYCLLSLGESFNKVSQYSTNVPSSLTFTREYADEVSHSFAYRVGLGVDMDVTHHARLGLAYRFAGLGRADLGAANINGIPVSGTLAQSNLYSNEIMLQWSYII